MREAKIDRVKRRMLKEAVADNLDTIRGLPPRALRTHVRFSQTLLRRSPFLLIPLLAGSTWLVATSPAPPSTPAVTRPAAILASADPAGVLAAPSSVPAPSPERLTAGAFPLSIRRVVLDAGHGGVDPGAVAGSLTEKEITLDIGNRLREMLQKSGFEVVSTRLDDRAIALRDRSLLANDSASDIFVSIHVNAIVQNTSSRGIETYYLGSTEDATLRQLAAAENNLSGYSMADMRRLLDRVYAGARADESRQLAAVLQNELYGALQRHDPALENWGVKRAPFLVLATTDMPAVLAEVGCLSNEREAAMLATPEYRQQIAEALFRGIGAYAGTSRSPREKGSKNG